MNKLNKAVKEKGIRSKQAQSARVEVLKQMTKYPDWKDEANVALKTLVRTYGFGQNRGGMIDYRKTGMFK